MNKKGNIEIHSKLKLEVYKKYLEAYLAIMMYVSWFKNIFIVEPSLPVLEFQLMEKKAAQL